MYVRWLKRDLTRTTRIHGRFGIGGHALSAVLVESRRVAGKPRQRFVAHLGTIRVWDAMMGKGDVPIAGGGRAHHVDARGFWDSVSRKLDVIERARKNGCRRIWLTTTNDRLRAIGFYQRLGFRMVAINLGAVDEARKTKPQIPETGERGVEIHDEIVMELKIEPYLDD